MENVGAALRGMYRDTIYDVENRLVYDSGWKSNTIVVNCRVLLACMMKGTGASGISGMKVGRGEEAWDNDPGPPPVDDKDPTLNKLVNEYVTKQPLAFEISFLDGNEKKTDQPTRRLEITVVLPADVPVEGQASPLREFALYGNNGQNMINCVRHPVIQKTAAETVIRTVWLYF
jgi:hypothetical protein